MIYIDGSSLPIADEVAEALKLRRVESQVTSIDALEREHSRDQATLLCGIAEDTHDPKKAEALMIQEAVGKGIQRLVMVKSVTGVPKLESQKNGRVQVLEADFSSEKYCPEFLRSLVSSLVSGEDDCVVQDIASVQLYQVAARVAQSDVGVFINGPTGTGKEVLSNFLHGQSRRKDEKFVALNCAAIPDHMLEAMLFGHVKGAFTGAASHSKGIFRAADKGTLLLDEISEMPLSLQAKLLRMLQERAVTPVGGTDPIPCDVRVLATSNRNMETEVKEGRFREDLYYRLNVFPLVTLPLSERKDDIIPLSAHMMLRHNQDCQDLPFLTRAAAERLRSHDWPGNVRELENVIQRATVLATDNVVDEDDILINSQPLVDKMVLRAEKQFTEIRV
ncbi:MAG: sigma-54 dependent transcriptional regulator [Rhodospirillaceae bacterium]|jgi:two-component system response regulator FlrC